MKSSDQRRFRGVAAALAVTTLMVFWRVKDFSFINYDDGTYVRENVHVLEGLTPEGVSWAFTATDAANWHPLTWLSLMLDTSIVGKEPGGYHVVNLVFHVANALVLFLVLQRVTGALGKSALVAALFAVHPLHVESVAWVSERKDVLSTLFLLLAIGAYLRYVQRPILSRYLVTLLLFSLGLLAKPMVVTLPLLLLLLDWWPLGRLAVPLTSARERPSRLLLEKVPMLLLSAASAAITLAAQAKGGTLSTVEMLPSGVRVSNALLSYLQYIGKALWPMSLAFFYPHPGPVPWWKPGLALLVLVALTALALRSSRRRPYTTVGWFWYLGSLVPVIGFVQVGAQAGADRYTYVPLIGLSVAVSWGVPGYLDAKRHPGAKLAIGSLAVVAALSIAAFRQVGYWRDSATLFTRALAVTSDNFLAHNNLGNVLLGQRRFMEAAAEFRKALLLKPADGTIHYNLALALSGQGREEEAAVQYEAALMLNPRLGEAHNNLGFILARRGKQPEAIEHFRKALSINALNSGARFHLALALQQTGRLGEAVGEYRRVISESPDDAQAHNNLGAVLAAMGRVREALPHFREAARLDPANVEVLRNLERAQRAINDRPGP